MTGISPLGGAPLGAFSSGGGGGGGGPATIEVTLTEGLGVSSDLLGGGIYTPTLSDGWGVADDLTVLASGDLEIELVEGIGVGPDTSSVFGFFGTIEDGVRFELQQFVARAYLGFVEETLGIEPLIRLHYGVIMTERVALQNTLTPGQILGPRIVEAMQLLDVLRLAYTASIEDGIAIELTQEQQQAVRLVEQIGVAQVASANGYFGVTLADQLIRLRDTLVQFFGAEVTEDILVHAAEAAQGRASSTLVDGVGITAEITPQLLLSATLSENIELEPEQVLTMLFQPTLIEGIELSAGYVSPDGSFTAWTMNARSGAVTEYTNYAFNSFAALGGQFIGASSEGLYDLSGDDDEGTDIIARLRGGYMQFGGTHLSRLGAAYIAARGEGEFILRIETGDGLAYNYQVSTRNMRSTKIKMGKGQRARYFNFELVSAGQDFDLDTLEFVPIVMQRRV